MKNKQGVLRWILGVSGADLWQVAALTLLEMALGGGKVLLAWLLGALIDGAVSGVDAAFWKAAWAFVALICFQLTLRALYRHFAESSKASLENRFKKRLFAALMGADFASVGATHSGEWMNRLTSDTVAVANGVATILPDISGMVVQLLAALSVLLVMIPAAAYVIIPGGIAMVLLGWILRQRMKSLHKTVQEADGALRSYLTEQLGAMQVLRAFGKQGVARVEAGERMDAHRAARMKKNWFYNLGNVGIGVAIQGTYALGVLYSGYGILRGTVSYGTFTAVLQLIGQVQGPLANISGFVPVIYGTLASAERLMEAESFRPDCPDGCITREEARQSYEKLSAIELRDLRFTYPGDQEPTLRGRSLTLGKGEYVAFTGHSGCGKSTVLKLLLSLYPLDGGEKNLRLAEETLPLTARHRTLFAYVPQGNALMSGTVRDAVTFGDAVEEERLSKALQIACAEEFVGQLEHGLDTLLGERGAGLSEGQLQRLAIARAVYAQRPILLLDEATSALDEATEAQVLKNLRAMTDKTVVIVTHRPAALAICDKEVHFG